MGNAVEFEEYAFENNSMRFDEFEMKILESGILSSGLAGSDRAVLTSPTVVSLSNDTLLATCRSGSTKDSDDEIVELYRSVDGGRTWSQPRRCFGGPTIEGVQGTLKDCYLTELSTGHLIAACLWVDRETYPGQPLFNPETEGCLPLAIVLADSYDFGESWTPWRKVSMPADIAQPALTDSIMKLADGTLVMSVETSKHFTDRSKWYQRVVLFFSTDLGHTWGEPVVAAQDPTGRSFYWDQRVGVAPDGRIATFAWTYDSETHAYLNIHRRLSSDRGRSWSPAEDLGFADQPAHPAILPDGRVVLAWVDRFKTHSIRARLAPTVEAAFDARTEVAIYCHHASPAQALTPDATGALLENMALWTFGLPYAEALPDGDVLIVYYAGTEASMDIHWSRLDLSSGMA